MRKHLKYLAHHNIDYFKYLKLNTLKVTIKNTFTLFNLFTNQFSAITTKFRQGSDIRFETTAAYNPFLTFPTLSNGTHFIYIYIY